MISLTINVPFEANEEQIRNIRSQIDQRNEVHEAMGLALVEIAAVPFQINTWVLQEVANEHS